MTARKSWQAALLGGAVALCFSAGATQAQTYTLVQGLDKFEGSTAAWHLLETNGFVVADPSFKQIFEPYLDDSMAIFITPDSAWHAYHVLLEEGTHELETAQSGRLADFSRRLWSGANEQAKSAGTDFSELARFAAIGLALQDETFRKSLPDDEKCLAETLLTGNGEVRVEIGFPLWAPDFQGHAHESSAAWAGYAAARQWYATVVFRLSDARETRLALCLSWLINKEPDLLQDWRQLSDPWDTLLAPAEDGSMPLYWDSTGKLPGANFTLATLLKNAIALQSRLAASLPKPRFNDQRLSADDAARFDEVIKGFRLLPPRRLPSEICFQNTTDPRISERTFPSGLDFFVASPVLRSPAAERALEAAEGGAVAVAVRKAAGGPLPESLRGRALRLLATLQEPLPLRVGPALRSEAWAEAQLWSQLGAWAEEEHHGNARRTVWFQDGAGLKPSAGVVAPYPDFFAGLGKLALDTAATLEKAGIDEPFDSKTAARKLLEAILWREGLGARTQEESERMAGLMEQFYKFWQHSLRPHQTDLDNNPAASQKLINDLEALARRCSTQTAPADADRDVLLSFFREQQTVPKLLREFAPVCDKLAGLARKHLEGTALTEEDTKWMGDYGTALAHFQSYAGTSADAPCDDFPIINRFQGHPGQAGFYTGVGRPQALYIILPAEGRFRLFRGAVMSYREFARTNAEALDDESWRALARTGEVPPPPPFTRSFRVERDAAELIKSFASASPDTEGYKDIAEALEELQSRVTDRDVPELIAALGAALDGPPGPAAEGIAAAIAKLHWEAHQREILALLEKNGGQEARTVAPILLQRAEALDAVFLSANFEHAPAPARRVYCALLSRLPQTDQTREVLLRALSDPAPAVRWEAATLMGAVAGNVPEKTAALLGRLHDNNEYVTAAAVSALGQLGATNAAPALLASLDEYLQKPELSAEDLQSQGEAARDFPLSADREQPRVEPAGRLVGPRRGRFAGGFPMRPDGSPARAALIEALGELHYQPAEERIFGLLDGAHAAAAGNALKKLAPEKLARHLEAEACDTKADPQARDRALLLLGAPPANSSATVLIPLLEDATVVPSGRPLPGREWRICDRAAATISSLLGKPVRIVPMQPTDQRDQQIEQIRQLVKSAY